MSEIIEYLDGSANKFIIKYEKKIILEYIPIKPLMSSSGIYDGGDYTKKEISKTQYDKIKSIFKEAIRNKEIHVKSRVKMSGMITIQEEKQKKTVILSPGSKELNQIDKIMRDLIKN